jgi:hypothetical protein
MGGFKRGFLGLVWLASACNAQHSGRGSGGDLGWEEDASTGEGEAPDDDDDDGGDETGDGEPGGDGSCDEFSFTFDAKPPNVMLVLDKSRSMTTLWNHDNNPLTAEISRWHSLHNVVSSLLAELGDEFHFGTQLFPSAEAYLDEPANAWSCRVHSEPEVPIGAGTANAILAAMPPAADFDISGGTPAVAGLQAALDHFADIDEEGPQAIVLVTDGAANCSPDEAPQETLFVYDDDVPEVVAAAFEMLSIPVYVVGINIVSEMGTKPAVNPHDAITDVANAGGAPAAGVVPFYNAFNEPELHEALQDVLEDIECIVNLDEEPPGPGNVKVWVDLVEYGPVVDCEHEDGWTFTDPDGPLNAIQLCGSACGVLGNGGLVEVDYVCPG